MSGASTESLTTETVASPPIHRLFVEILHEIFLLTLPRQHDGFYDVFNVAAGPWLIARVCSLWRGCSNHLLWCRMIVSPGRYNRRICKDPISLYTTALSHTGNHYLDIKLNESFSTDCPLALKAELLDISMIHCRRWRNVVVFIPSPLSARFLEVRGRLDLLSHITIFCQDDSDALNVFDDAPMLTGVYINVWHPRQSFPWSQLVSYSNSIDYGDDEATAAFLRIIQKAPSLRDFRIPYNADPDNPATSRMAISPVTHANLRVLHAAEPNLLAALTLPALTETKLGSPSDLDYPSSLLTELLSLILRSRCSLTKLTLENVEMTEVVVDILDLAPQLDTLDIEIGGSTPECDPILQTLFQRLACLSTDSKHVPFLAQLAHIRICIMDTMVQQPFRFMDSVFFNVVSSRWSSQILKSVSIHIVAPTPSPGWGLTVQHIKTLQRFKMEGLDIKISVLHCAGNTSRRRHWV
ncbi:uncharacterized protein ARMOST_19869 [Armillaria ostoyae]|uniref:F-box domain-containing protein n=1 Tax=Armillaria ostoyae TaxID=47428 RepID=A0A284S5Q8_ARMOS|nr:uncharacterized protein ARMOST_19869 [Armillaria ostoyae]